MNKIKYIMMFVFLLISLPLFSKGNIMINSSLSNDFYHALYRGTSGYEIDKVRQLLSEGADPNYCKGESGWVDSNPLNVVADSFYPSYLHVLYKDNEITPAPDITIFQYLMDADADIDSRPYVWERVFIYNNEDLEDVLADATSIDPSIDAEGIAEAFKNFMNDCNRLIEAFLEAGADPDMLGHPYPFSYEGMKARITDEQAKEYFKKGTRAINVAIKKGIAWESQVDLLLKYTNLDEDSLVAAKESNDPLMVKKINTLWEEQKK